MEHEGSFPCWQQRAVCPHPEPDESSPRPHPVSSKKSILILSSHICLPVGISSGFFPTGFPHQNQ